MRVAPHVLLLLAIVLAVLALPGRAEEEAKDRPRSPEEVRARVAAWLDDLSSPSFEVREAARKGLRLHASAARDLLESRRDDPDPEVRRTIRTLLERLGSAPRAHTPPAADMSELGRVTLVAEGRLADLLAAVGEAHGARFDVPDGFGDREIDVALEGRSFFGAVTELAALAGLAPRGHFDAGGRLTLRPAGEVDALPTATAGPLRARVVEVTSVKTLGRVPRRRYLVALDVDWPPSVQLIRYRTPTEIHAADEEGRVYEAGMAARRVTTYGLSGSARQRRIDLPLEPRDAEAQEHLAHLAFTLPVRVRHDRAVVRFPMGEADAEPRTLAASGRAAKPGEVGSVTLRSLARSNGDRGHWLVDLSARLAEPSRASSLRVWLERADGTLQAAAAGSRMPSADGLLELTARAFGRDDEPPVAVLVTWFRAEEDGELRFRLADVPLR